jgi:hypothetical protein
MELRNLTFVLTALASDHLPPAVPTACPARSFPRAKRRKFKPSHVGKIAKRRKCR